MSNNKQSMKLYTHEEIVNFLKKEFADEINAETFMENLTPLERPSDEEIQQESLKSDFEYTFRNGAKWMRDKIQGGNK